MNIRQRKLACTVIFVTGSVCYFFFVITVAIARLPSYSYVGAASLLSRDHVDLVFLLGPLDTLDAEARFEANGLRNKKGRSRGPMETSGLLSMDLHPRHRDHRRGHHTLGRHRPGHQGRLDLHKDRDRHNLDRHQGRHNPGHRDHHSPARHALPRSRDRQGHRRDQDRHNQGLPSWDRKGHP